MSDAVDYTPAHYTPDTQIIWAEREGHIGSAFYYLLCFLFSWLLVPLVLGIVRYLSVITHTYEVTAQRLRIKKGIFFRQTEVLELYRVKDISIDQPLMQRLAGCGRVIIDSTDLTAPRIVLEAVPDPIAVADLLRDSVERCRVAKGVREFQ